MDSVKNLGWSLLKKFLRKNGHAYLILSATGETSTNISGYQKTIDGLKESHKSFFSNQGGSGLPTLHQQGGNKEFIKINLEVSFDEALFWLMTNSAFEMIKCDSKFAIFRKISRQENKNKEDKEEFFIPENSAFKAEVIE